MRCAGRVIIYLAAGYFKIRGLHTGPWNSGDFEMAMISLKLNEKFEWVYMCLCLCAILEKWFLVFNSFTEEL